MGKKTVLVDTNVIISGFGWNGICRKVINKIIEEEYEWYIFEDQILEIEQVLTYNKLQHVPKTIINFLEKYCHKIILKTSQTTIDEKLIITAIQIDAILITGDKEVLSSSKCKLMTAREFLNNP